MLGLDMNINDCSVLCFKDIDDGLYSRSMLQGESQLQIRENILITASTPAVIMNTGSDVSNDKKIFFTAESDTVTLCRRKKARWP